MNRDEEEIVISGISGRFPQCRNVEEFRESLLKGIDLLSIDDHRFPAGLNGLPKRQGKVPDIDKFDADFFGLHSKQAHYTDPRQRILLETAYEAILDAGFNPSELRGTKTGVFIGMSLFTNFTELTEEDKWGYSILGASHVSASNRISYCFDLKGPSYSIDTGCSSSLYAFSQAVDSLKRGDIDYALVGGTHLGLHPEESLQYHKLSMLSPDGKCKVFSSERNGFARSEAVCCYFLQKKKSSRRVYAVVVGAKTNTNGYVKEGFTVPSAEMQLKLMQELYKEVNVDVKDVAYVEMHGTGSRIGDIIECKSILDMFGANRKKPILVGSVKSNMGHGETVSGLAAITKVLIAMKTGIIPANIHLDPVDNSLPGIGDGKLQIVASNTFWNPGIVGINSFGFGGANAHVILKPADDDRRVAAMSNRKHRLVQVSGRTEECVKYFLDQIVKSRNDEGVLALVDQIHSSNIEGHLFRGYSTLGETPHQEITQIKSTKRPIWFIYSGMGSHWPGMGKELMQYEVFRSTIIKCAEALKPYGINLIDIIMNPNEESLKNLGNCFCTIIAIDVAITDLLASVGVKPDYFAGHSLGEVGCAYANGDLSPEQAVLLAYSKYYAVSQQEFPEGQMAAVALSPDEITKILPDNVFVACQNSRSSVTISGLEQPVIDFVDKLTAQGVFARLVYTGRIAFHSKFLMDSHKHLQDFIQKVIPNPKPRSKKWITTSVTEGDLQENWANYNCAKYHSNNYMNKVLLDRVYQFIQPDAVVIEIAPHGILHSVLKKELGSDNILVSVLDKNHPSQEQCLLKSIGRLYNAGAQPNLRNLYKDPFPVSPGTKMLSPFLKWDHNKTWFVPYWKNRNSSGKVVDVNLEDEKFGYLKGCNVNGRVLLPAAALLEMVWKIRSELESKDYKKTPVTFNNVKFHNPLFITDKNNIKLLVNVSKETGYYEITKEFTLISTGYVLLVTDSISNNIKEEDTLKTNYDIKKEDFYKILSTKQYFYCGEFRGVNECDLEGTEGVIESFDNYVTFIEAMLQLYLLESNEILLIRGINKVVIDPVIHQKEGRKKYQQFHRNKHTIKSAGIQIHHPAFEPTPPIVKPTKSTLQVYKFIEYDSTNTKYDAKTSLYIALQIILQNVREFTKKLRVARVENDEIIDNDINYINDKLLNGRIDYIDVNEASIKEIDVIITKNFDSNQMDEYKYVIYTGSDTIDNSNVEIIFQSKTIKLLRTKIQFPIKYDTINIRITDFKWLEKLRKCLEAEEERNVYLFSQNERYSGLIGLVESLRRKDTRIDFKAVLIDDKTDIFSMHDEFYREQLSKGLSFNVLKCSKWGTYIYLPFNEANNLTNTENATVAVDNKNNDVKWIQKPVPYNPVNVRYSTLDVDYYKNNKITEFSGLNKSGKSVMGLCTGGLSLKVDCNDDFTWDVPDYMSLQDAVTIPLPYVLSYYGLVIKSKITQKTSILIHNAASDVGIASISIALHQKSKIYATIKSEENLTILKKLYPELDTNNIIDLNRFTIDSIITNEDIDIVVNTDNDEGSIDTLLNCLTNGGVLLNTSEDICINCRKDVTYYSVNISKIHKESVDIKTKIKELITNGLKHKVITPIPSIIYKADDIQTALNRLKSSSSNNTEKIVIEINNDIKEIVPKLYFNPYKTYVIIGFGSELTGWLTQKGATKIVINTEIQSLNGYQKYCIKNWTLNGVEVIIDKSNLTSTEGAEALFKKASKVGPIGGVFITKLGKEDTVIKEEAETVSNDFKEAEAADNKILKEEADLPPTKLKEEDLESFINKALNIDAVTRQLCPDLEHFVVLLSTPDTLLSSVMEKICEVRQLDGLQSTAIQSSTPHNFDALEKFMLQKVAIGSSIVNEEVNKVAAATTKTTKIDAVAKILGIDNLDSINKQATLSQLGLDSLMLAEVKHTLYKVFELDFNPEEIRELTFDRLIVLQNDAGRFRRKLVESFPPPLLSDVPIIKLNDCVRSSKIIFMIHPIEGYLHYLTPLAKKIPCIVYGIQCTSDSNYGTIPKNAEYFKRIIKKIQSTGTYYLCGYSYGATLGFEIGLQLEKDGDKVELVAIDGAPDYARQVFKNKHEMSLKITRLFPALFKEVDLDKIKLIINESDRVYEMISQQTGIKYDDVKLAGEHYLSRCLASFLYHPVGKFGGKVVLLRRSHNPQAVSNDYGLQKVCSQKVDVINLDGDHITILFGDNLEKLVQIVKKWILS